MAAANLLCLSSLIAKDFVQPKHFNWFCKKLALRPGSIENLKPIRRPVRTIRSSMGDCHSFDPGSKFGDAERYSRPGRS